MPRIVGLGWQVTITIAFRTPDAVQCAAAMAGGTPLSSRRTKHTQLWIPLRSSDRCEA